MSGLSNADFRSMMMTPRRESSDDSSNPMPPPKKIASRKRPTPATPKEKPQPTPKRTPTDSKYRDRAAERREGANQDYNSEEMEMLSTYHHVPPNATREELEQSRLEAIEKSKYLGGDMEHTHLVKGLDYALLQKARSEQVAFEDQEDDEEPEKSPEPQETFYKTITVEKEEEEVAEPIVEERATVHFNGIVAKSVHYNLFSKKIPKINDLFVNGRTVFQFDLEDGDIPTVVVKSKENDIPKYKELIKPEMEAGVLEKLSSVMAYVRTGGSKKKGKKEEPQVAMATVKKPVVEDDEEIFPDAGAYVPSIPEPSKQAKKGSYFGESAGGSGKDEMEIEAPVIPEAWKKTIEAAKKNKQEEEEDEGEYVFDINKFDEPIDTSILEEEEAKRPKSLHAEIEEARKKRTIDPKKDPSYIDNDYAECYPGTYESNFVDYEGSDEEEDLSKMDVGKNLRLHRKDFASEEAWSSYNDKREALPKAAFQFGVKMADGRKTRKHKDQNQKIEKDLKKLNEYIKKKENIKSTPVPTAIEARKKMKHDN